MTSKDDKHDEHFGDLLDEWYKEEEQKLEKNNFNDEEKLKDRESKSQQRIVEEAFKFWKHIEEKREGWKKFLLYGFAGASLIQIVFIILIIIFDATLSGFNIRDGVFISVILGTLAQIIGVIMVITRSLFENKYDKIITLVTSWIERK